MKAILFDFWGTLLNSRFDAVKAYEEILKSATRNPRNLTAQDLAVIGKEVFDRLRARNPITGPEFTFRDEQEIIEQEYDLRFSTSYEERELLFLKYGHSDVRLVSGLPEFLKQAARQGYRMGIVSNTIMSAKTLLTFLSSYCDIRYFDFLLASSEEKFRKPAPEIFFSAARKLSVDPAAIYFIGDSYTADIVGAYTAGMKPVYLLSPRDKALREDIIYRSFSSYFELTTDLPSVS